jgi:hypothetical protein
MHSMRNALGGSEWQLSVWHLGRGCPTSLPGPLAIHSSRTRFAGRLDSGAGPHMKLDDLVQEVRAVSADPAVQGVADQLADWKESSATADDLSLALERYIGNVWIASRRDHERVYALWSSFLRVSISAIRGMTMNERLCCFSLLERLDSTKSDADRQALYRKLHAGEV